VAEKHSARIIPEGPPIWICGDCHIGNIGPLADSRAKSKFRSGIWIKLWSGTRLTIWSVWPFPLPRPHEVLTCPALPVAKMMEQVFEGYEQALTTPIDRTQGEG
jgi:hypothetical protein